MTFKHLAGPHAHTHTPLSLSQSISLAERIDKSDTVCCAVAKRPKNFNMHTRSISSLSISLSRSLCEPRISSSSSCCSRRRQQHQQKKNWQFKSSDRRHNTQTYSTSTCGLKFAWLDSISDFFSSYQVEYKIGREACIRSLEGGFEIANLLAKFEIGALPLGGLDEAVRSEYRRCARSP